LRAGRREWVTPIVVFVGDWKIRNDWHNTDTRVLTPDGLLRYIRNQQPQLTRNEIQVIASHLERSGKRRREPPFALSGLQAAHTAYSYRLGSQLYRKPYASAQFVRAAGDSSTLTMIK
jgi:hypothetical protein